MRQGSKRATRNSNRSGLLTGGLLTLMCVPALAGPEGERVVRGNAEFQRAGDVTTIVAADRTIINYRSFDIGAGETVRFVQPDADSRVLNRIKSATPTQIDGSLFANGRVYLVNAAGVTFGQGAVVDVGQLYAAAGNISNRDFLAGRDNFTLSGEVVNNGTIRAEQGVSLFGRSVINYGSISAPGGLVTLATGDGVYVGERGGHVFLKIDGGKAPGAGGVENSGTLSAQDLIVGAGDMYSVVLHDPSVLTAQRIRVEGGAGTTTIVKGTLDATNDAGQGGEIQVLGDKVALYGATLDASGRTGGGEILVGGDFQGQGDVRTSDRTYVDAATTLQANATGQGDGGKVIVWADEVTGFLGQVNARGAGESGSGGFAEVSGKHNLLFVGDADLSAGEGGQAGTILFDPDNVTITDGAGGADDANADFSDGSILSGEGPVNAFISEQFLEGFGGAVVIQANDNITINNLTDNILDFAAAAGTVQFAADFDADGSGNFSMDVTDTIRTQGANLDISGDVLTVHGVTTNGGSISLSAVDGITLGNGSGSVTLATGGGSFTAEANSDFDATGVFNTTSGATVSSGGGNITIAGGQWTIGATGTINAGAGDVTFNASRSVSASVGNTSGTINLSAAELARITTSGTFSVGTGGITPTSLSVQNFDNGSGITGNVVLQAAGDVNFVSSQSDFDADLTVIADGSVNLTSTADVTVGGDLSITADNDGDNNNGGTPDILNIGGSRSLTATGTVDVAAADVTIDAGGALSGSTVTIDRSSAGSIGFGVDAGEDMVLDEDEIDRIVADDLIVGGDVVTDIVINTVDGVNGLQFATINNEVTFNAGGTGGNIVVSGEMTTPGAVNFLAADGVTISANVTSAGAVLVNANSDALVDGGAFQVDDSFTLDSANNDIIIIASDLVLGAGTIGNRVDAGTQDIIISQWTSTESIGLGGGAGTMSVTAAELGKLAAATLTIGGDGTNPDVAEVDAITLDGASFAGITGLVTLNATTSTGTITFTGADSTTPAGLTAQAGNGITFDAGATISGTASLDADFLDAGTGIFTINAGETLTVSGAALTITARDADLGGAISNAGQTTTITGSQVTDSIDLGTSGTGTMALSSAELATITAQNLVIGGTGSSTRMSEVTVDGLLSTAFAGITTGVTINAQQAGGTVVFSGSASAFTSGKTVQVNAENGITVSANVTTAGTTTLRADFDSDGTGTLAVDDGATFSSGSSALSILAGDVSLAGSSGTRLSSSVLSIAPSTTGSTIGLGDAAGGLSLGNSELARITAGTSLTVGAGTNTGGITADGVDSANLSGIGTLILETAGSVVFSGADSSFGALTANADAGITVSGVALSTGGTTTLDADDNADGTGTFTVSGGGSYATTGGASTIQAADVDITGASDVTIGGTSLTITTSQTTRDISVGANNGGLHLSNAELSLISGSSLVIGAASGATSDSVTVDDVDIADLAGVTGVTFNANAAGGVVQFINNASGFDGSVTAQARDGIVVSADLTTGGAATFDADFNNDAVGDFTLSGNLVSGGDVAVIGDDADITGSIDASGFNVLFARSSADAMFVGTAGAGFSLSTAELATVTAGSLTIGGTTGGREVDSITVDGLGAGALANITGTVTLNATGDGGTTEGTVVFSGSDSTFAADLEVNADEGIDQDVTVTVGGAAAFNADADSDNSGAYDLAAGEALIVTDTVDLTAASVAFGAGAALTNTGGTVTIQHSAAGTIGLGSGAGDLTLDNTVLGAIDTANLTIGGADTATITVDNASFAGVTGTLTLDASAAGGAISFENGSVSVSAGLVATATDSITVGSGADVTIAGSGDGDGSFSATTITISDDITFTNNGALAISATDIFLGADASLTTAGAAGDDIVVTGDVESTGGTARNLTVNAGLGDVTFNDTIGLAGGTALVSALDVTGATITMSDSTFTDLSQTYSASTLLRLGNSGGTAQYVVANTGDFDASGSDTQLLGNVTIINQGTLDGDDILFGAVDGDGNGPWDIGMSAGGLGDIVVNGAIGAIEALDQVLVNDADDADFGGDINAGSFLQANGSGTTTLSGVTVTGAFGAFGAGFTLNGPVSTGASVMFTNSGTLDINGTVTAGTTFSQTGGGSVTIADGADITGGTISFDDGVTLDGGSTVNLLASSGIDFGGTLDAADGTLNLTTDGALGFGSAVSGTGTLNITSASGVTGDIGIGDDATGDLTIDTGSAGNVQSGFAAVNVGTATTGEHDFQFLDNDEDIVLNSAMTFHAPVAGEFRVQTSIDGSAVTTGAFTFEGSGGTTILSADIISGGADIIINDSVVIDENADITLDSGGGDISITGTVEGTTGGGDESLTFDGGGAPDGTITVGDTLSGSAGTGDATGLATIGITAGAATSFQAIFITGNFTTGTLSGNFSAAGAFEAANIIINAGADDVTLSSTVNVSGDVTLSGNDVSLGDALTSTGGGMAVTNSGVLTIDGAITLAGVLIQSGGGTVILNADIDSGGGDITFADTIATTGDRVIDAGTGQQAYSGTITAANNMTFIGTGDGVNDGISFAAGVDGTGDITFQNGDATGAYEVGDNTAGASVLFDGLTLGQLSSNWNVVNVGSGSESGNVEVGDLTLGVPLNINAGSGGIDVTGALGLTGSGDALNLNTTSGVTISAGGSVATTGGAITIQTGLIIGENADASVDSGDGAIDIQGAIAGTTGGGNESLILDAGTGSITIAGSVTGDGSAADATGLSDFTFNNAGIVDMQGLAISGTFNTSNRLTGDLTTNGQDIVGGIVDLSGIGFDLAGIESSDNVFIDNNGLLRIDGDVSTQGAFFQLSGAGTGTVELGGDIDTNNAGSVGFQSGVTLFNGDRSIEAGINSIIFSETLNTDGFSLSVAANGIDFDGGVGSVSGGNGANRIVLTPATATTAIDVGDVVGSGGVLQGGLDINADDIAALAEGFLEIVIGIEGTGSHSIQVGTSTFADAVEFHAPVDGATDGVRIIGTLTSSDDTSDRQVSIEILGSGTTTTLSADIITAGGDIFIDDNVVVAEAASITLDSNNGDIEITGTLQGTTGGADEDIAMAADAGMITIGGTISGNSGGSDATGLTEVFLLSADGGISIQGVSIFSVLDVGFLTRIGGSFTTNGQSINVGSGNFVVTDADFGVIDVTLGDFNIDNSGLLDLNGDFTSSGGSFAQTDTLATGNVELGGNLSTFASGGDISFVSDVLVTDSSREIDAGTGGITIGGAYDSVAFDSTFSGNRIDFNGGADSVTGTGVLTIRPADENTDLDVGNIAGAGGTPGAGL
ncbi:MAG: filamentous hemagglutinin N-terminal domain-containing protein, partial [Phycisphaerales bacterium]|nr:filamentous hemagglutinin N-terminal domain-containing protein [Phycisphaerales bacterium]